VNVGVSWSDIGFSGSVSVRDLWARSALGNFTGGYNATVAMHDVSFVRCSQL
jgi:alpha-galactosidase